MKDRSRQYWVMYRLEGKDRRWSSTLITKYRGMKSIDDEQ